MTKGDQWMKDDMLRMYRSLTDPDEQARARREAERKERAEEKSADVGL